MKRPEEVLAEVFGVDPHDLDDASSPDTIATWDSLSHMTMLVALEGAYGVSVSPADAIAVRTVGEVKEMLRDHGVRW